VTIEDGDTLQFKFPPEIGVPATEAELDIQPISRLVNQVEVKDELKVVLSGSLLTITFVKVAPTT